MINFSRGLRRRFLVSGCAEKVCLAGMFVSFRWLFASRDENRVGWNGGYGQGAGVKAHEVVT